MKNALLALLVFTSVACSGQTLDQDFSPATPNVSFGIDGASWARGQTFTVGQTGVLIGIDLLAATNGFSSPVLWDIRSTVAGLPVASNLTTLASGVIDGIDLPAANTFHYFDFASANIAVSSGDVLAITLRGTSMSTVASLHGRDDDGYAGGTAVQGTPGAPSINWSAIPGVDFGIKTYMAIPEPSTYAALAGLGALAVAALHRKREN